MEKNNQRIALLNGVLVILGGMLIAGLPLNALVIRDAYGIAIPAPSGDYRAWVMAHLEGLLNGLMVIALALAVDRCRMSDARSRVFAISLSVAAWCNLIASTISAIFQVRAMTFNGQFWNDAAGVIYSVGLIGTIVAFYIAIATLLQKAPPASQE